jgi:hypothetical protein
MQSFRRRELLYFAIALAIPVAFFSLLPWNIDNAAREYMDHFFGADVWRVYQHLITSDEMQRSRDMVHPYFSLFAVTAARSGRLLGAEGGEFLAYRTIFGSAGVFLFWLFLYRCTSAIIAFSAVALLLSTMTVRVWSVVPETYLFGFCTLMLGLNLARIRGNCPATLIVSLSGTITNGALGIFYALQRIGRFDWKKAILITLIIVFMLSTLQKNLYPTVGHFFNIVALQNEERYVYWTPWRLPFKTFDFLYSGFVLPLPDGYHGRIATTDLWREFIHNYDVGYGARQAFAIALSVLIITGCLVVAVANFFRTAKLRDVGTLVAAFIAFELFLHLLYGYEPFLYSYHFLPFLIIFMTLYLPGEKTKALLLAGLAVCVQDANFDQWHRFQQIFG